MIKWVISNTLLNIVKEEINKRKKEIEIRNKQNFAGFSLFSFIFSPFFRDTSTIVPSLYDFTAIFARFRPLPSSVDISIHSFITSPKWLFIVPSTAYMTTALTALFSTWLWKWPRCCSFRYYPLHPNSAFFIHNIYFFMLQNKGLLVLHS